MRRYAGFVLIVLLAACTDKDKIPSDVLPRERMEKVMWDMMQADQYAGIYLAKDTVNVGSGAGAAAAGVKGVKDSAGVKAGTVKNDVAAARGGGIVKDSAAVKDSIAAKVAAREQLKVETLKLYQEVFALNNVTREEFSRSYKFYQSRPDLTRGMFDSLIAKGNRLRTENYNRPPGPSQATTNPPTPVPIQPTSTNSIKTNIPGGLIKNQPGGHTPALQRAPGYMPQGRPPLTPTAAPGQRPAGLPPGTTPKTNDTSHVRKKVLPL